MSGGQILIIGAGGHAKVAISMAEASGIGIGAVFDDDPAKQGRQLIGYAVTAPTPAADWWRGAGSPAIIAIGDNRARQRIAAALPARWMSLIHPSAVSHASVAIGEGTFVCAGALIQPDAQIGVHAIINTGAVIEHDCRVGAFVHVAGAACLAGASEVGEGSFIGAGAVVLPGVKVGAWVTVGAGAVVTQNVADGLTVAGVPAKPLS